jgi:CDC24 Calponin
MAEPLMVPRQQDYPMPGHLQRAQTTPANRVDDLFFAPPNEAKRATSPVPQRLPTVAHSAKASYSTPSSITPSSTPPLVVNGVPLTGGAVLNRQQPPRSTPASLAPTTSSTTSTVSLYQTSIALRDRLQGVQGFQHFLELTEKPNSTDPDSPSEHDTLDLDVVSHLWRCFMLGPSLCCIYNALNPEKKLEINRDCTLADLKECKKAVYHFLVAIKDIVPSSKLFTISDLYNNNTNGIVKVHSAWDHAK